MGSLDVCCLNLTPLIYYLLTAVFFRAGSFCDQRETLAEVWIKVCFLLRSNSLEKSPFSFGMPVGCSVNRFLFFCLFMPVFVQEYTLSEYLRMSGIYWGLTVMDLMGQLPRMNRQEIIDFIKACQHECGGISASIGHDPHLLYTLSAVQVTPKTASVKCDRLTDLSLSTYAVRGWNRCCKERQSILQRCI